MVDHIDWGDVARGSVNQGDAVPPVHSCPFTVMVAEYIDSRHNLPCYLFVHRAYKIGIFRYVAFWL
jgi:hypothetical protein